LEDIPRYTGRAHDTLRVSPGAGDHEGVVDVRVVEVLVVGIEERRVVVLPPGVVVPRLSQVALHADDRAVVGMLVVRGARAAFYVASPELDRDLVCRIGLVWRADLRRRAGGDAPLFRCEGRFAGCGGEGVGAVRVAGG